MIAMELRLLNKETDLEEVNAWLPFKANSDEIPGHTYCVVSSEQIVAVAALRLAEGPVCVFDSMATNPSFSSETRNAAIEMLIAQIIKTARDLNFKAVMASTSNPSIVKRALKHEFVPVPEIVMVKIL